MKQFNNLNRVKIELTSKCNKSCWMCSRKYHTEEYGDMDFDLIKKISKQLPDDIVVQFHNNGESSLHPRFGEAIRLFKRQFRSMDTNGKTLIEKHKDFIGGLDSLVISIFENDVDQKEQYNLVKEFIKIKGDQKPFMVYRLLGNVDSEPWKKLPGIVCRRTFVDNKIRENIIPEIGVCFEALNLMTIDREGRVFICAFKPWINDKSFEESCMIGDANKKKLIDIWNGEKRKKYLDYLKTNRRSEIFPCNICNYWGIPY